MTARRIMVQGTGCKGLGARDWVQGTSRGSQNRAFASTLPGNVGPKSH